MDLRQVLKTQLSDRALEEIANRVTADDLMHLLENYMGDEIPFIEGRKWSVPTQEPYFKQFVKNVIMKEKKYMKMIFAFYMSHQAEQKLQCLKALIAQSKEDYEKSLDAMTVVDVEEKGGIPVHMQTEQLICNSTSGEPDAGLHLSLEVQLKLVQQGVLQKKLSDVIQHMRETLIIYEDLNSDVKMIGNQYNFVMTYRGQVIVSTTASTQIQAQKMGYLQFLQKYAPKLYEHFKPTGITSTSDKKNSYVNLFSRKAEHPQQSRFGVILNSHDAIDDLLQGKFTTISSSTLKKPNKQSQNSKQPSIQLADQTQQQPPKQQQKETTTETEQQPQTPLESAMQQETPNQLGFSSAQPQIDEILTFEPTFGLPGSQEILFESKPQMEEEQQQQQQPQQPQQPQQQYQQVPPTEEIVENKQFQLRDLVVNIDEPKYDIFDDDIVVDEQRTIENQQRKVETYHKILDMNPPGVSLVVPKPQHLRGPQYLNSREDMLVRLHQVTKLDIDTQKLDGIPNEALEDEKFVQDVIAIANILKYTNKNKYSFQVVIEQVRYENDKIFHRALMIVSKVGKNPDQEQFQLEEEKESHLKVKAYLMIIKVMLRKCYSDQSPPTRFLKIVNYVISKLQKKDEKKPTSKKSPQTHTSGKSSLTSTPNTSPPALITQMAPNFFQTLQEFTSKKKLSPTTKNQKVVNEQSTTNQQSSFYQMIQQQIKLIDKQKDQQPTEQQSPKIPTQSLQQQSPQPPTSKLLQSLQLPPQSKSQLQLPLPPQIPQPTPSQNSTLTQPNIKKKSPPKASRVIESSIDSKELESSNDKGSQNQSGNQNKKVGRPPKITVIKPTKKTKFDEPNKPQQQQPIQSTPTQEPPQGLIDIWTKPLLKQTSQPPRQNFHASAIQHKDKPQKDQGPSSEPDPMSLEKGQHRKHDNSNQSANRKERYDYRNWKKSQSQNEQKNNIHNPRYRTDSRNQNDDDSDYVKSKATYKKKKYNPKNGRHNRRENKRNLSRARARSHHDSGSPKRYNHRYDKFKKFKEHHSFQIPQYQGYGQALSFGCQNQCFLGGQYHQQFAPQATMFELTSMVTQLLSSMNQMMVTFTQQMSRR